MRVLIRFENDFAAVLGSLTPSPARLAVFMAAVVTGIVEDTALKTEHFAPGDYVVYAGSIMVDVGLEPSASNRQRQLEQALDKCRVCFVFEGHDLCASPPTGRTCTLGNQQGGLSDSSSGSSAGASAGIIGGAVAGMLLLILLIVVLVKMARRSGSHITSSKASSVGPEPFMFSNPTYTGEVDGDGSYLAPMERDHDYSELGSSSGAGGYLEPSQLGGYSDPTLYAGAQPAAYDVATDRAPGGAYSDPVFYAAGVGSGAAVYDLGAEGSKRGSHGNSGYSEPALYAAGGGPSPYAQPMQPGAYCEPRGRGDTYSEPGAVYALATDDQNVGAYNVASGDGCAGAMGGGVYALASSQQREPVYSTAGRGPGGAGPGGEEEDDEDYGFGAVTDEPGYDVRTLPGAAGGEPAYSTASASSPSPYDLGSAAAGAGTSPYDLGSAAAGSEHPAGEPFYATASQLHIRSGDATAAAGAMYDQATPGKGVQYGRDASPYYTLGRAADGTYAEVPALGDRGGSGGEHAYDLGSSVPPSLEFDRSRLVLGERIGEGSFGRVQRGEAREIIAGVPASAVAVKLLHEGASMLDAQEFLDEARLMMGMDPHPNVLRLLGVCTTSEPLLVISELCVHGNLQSYLRRARPVGEKPPGLTADVALRFAIHVAQGLEYLGRHQLVHRDLAARNVLVDALLNAKIADFGLARPMQAAQGHYRLGSTRRRLPIKWMAPESLRHGVFSIASDVWALGVVFQEIATLGGVPYPDMTAAQAAEAVMERGFRMPRLPHVSAELYALQSECWAPPAQRPSTHVVGIRLVEMMAAPQQHLCLPQSEAEMRSVLGVAANTSDPADGAGGDQGDDEYLKIGEDL